jgi:tRNA-dihydrouridine synthase
MRYYFAPMEGVTGAAFRQVHRRFFPEADRYYMPFLSPTRDHLLTPRERREVLPVYNAGVPAVPQLMTKNADDFCWAAGALAQLGYEEVNLNLGCPSGTVTAKGKGAGFLRTPDLLDAFLDAVFSRVEVAVSVKTRLGMTDPAEFPRLLDIFARYPIAQLTIHPRVRQDFYRHPVRREWFGWAAEHYPGPLCYNGGLMTAADCRAAAGEFPRVEALMLGRGLLTDPSLIRQAKGGAPAGRGELRAFHDALYAVYRDRFQSPNNAAFHLKELWYYMIDLFDGHERLYKQLRKAPDAAAYLQAVDAIFQTLPLKNGAD